MTENTSNQFLESCRREHKKIQRELKEVDMLIQQTSSEVDRLVQRNARAASRLRQVEAQFDTIPREDIKSAYTTIMESQQRLFTMRGQLEKLQSDQHNLTRLEELYEKILERGLPQDGMPAQAGKEGALPQSLVVNIIEAQERERQRLSRKIHDGPAQSLTNLVLQAEICERFFSRDPKQAQVELADLKKNVVRTFRSVKDFIFELRPMMLDDLGLIPTLKRYVEGLRAEDFAGVTLNITGKEQRLASYKEVTIFRVIQELIHIGRVYGHASSVKISLDMGEKQVRVVAEDNGGGFDLDDELTTADAGRLGLPTLRERIEMLGGKITFASGIGQGMHVELTLPVTQE
ncbi:MAG: sensor histidine kinase [Anaerolineae bacterium]|nr:sensor histidine kinase [Anaerolineae bacterium]